MVGTQAEIFLSPLNTNDGFYLSLCLYDLLKCGMGWYVRKRIDHGDHWEKENPNSQQASFPTGIVFPLEWFSHWNGVPSSWDFPIPTVHQLEDNCIQNFHLVGFICGLYGRKLRFTAMIYLPK